MPWLPIQLAPEDCDLEVGELDKTGILPLHFPCRRRLGVWYNAWADEPILIFPTHWKIWRARDLLTPAVDLPRDTPKRRKA